MWSVCKGVAVVKHSFIAEHQYEITVLTGDFLEIYEEEENWFRGKNTFTKKIGIFPKVCVSFLKTEDISTNSILGINNDLLVLEALFTINFSLKEFEKMGSSGAVILFDNISDIITNLKQLEDPKKRRFNDFIHRSLGIKIRSIREQLGLPEVYRCSDYYPSTISKWELSNFLSKNQPIPQEEKNPSKSPILHRYFPFSFL